MPYVQKLGQREIEEQLWQWEGVMHDPNIDGFNGWACKQKVYEVYFRAKEILDKAPTYSGEQDWVQDRQAHKAFKEIGGRT